MDWPRIVAEALRRVDGCAQIASRSATPASIATALAAIDAAQVPSRSTLPPPPFLRHHQHDAWRRVMAALDIWNGALLLESVGSGKTWIALAAAACERGRVLAIVPAILRVQWQDAALQAGIPLHFWTHERASRGALPPLRPSLVIIDEAHRLREPATRRVRTLAPWLVGRRTLLLTATPIVNRVADLTTLLHLALPENALALDGLARLSNLDTSGLPPRGLRRVAIRSSTFVNAGIDRRVTTMPPDESEQARAAAAVAAITGLTLSDSASTRRLLISVLLDAAASSDAAFHQALRRYRALLLQSRDAGGASRAMLRQFAGESLEQLVFWPLLTAGPATTDLPLADIARVEALLTRPTADDAWICGLAASCDDTRPTVYFTRHRATARQLRMALGDGAAWVTGSEAGIGPHRVPRAAVLAAFGAGRTSWQLRRAPPRALIATDVAAEGLDLQSAGRVVHVDLPWTATRLEQREGRLFRIGQQYPEVSVVVRAPGVAIERALAQRARVHRKRRLADEWLQALEAADRNTDERADTPLFAGLAHDGAEADMVALNLRRDRCAGVIVMTRERHGVWHTDNGAAATRIEQLRAAPPAMVDPAEVATVLASATHAATAGCMIDECVSPALVSRIHRLARQAAARRDGQVLRRLDCMLRFATAPPTLGSRALVVELLELPDRDFICRDLPEVARAGAVQVTVIAAILLRRPSVP